MLKINNKKIDISMINNARFSNRLNPSGNINKTAVVTTKIKQLKNDVYTYDNVNDVINYVKLNKNKKYAFVICGVGDFICIDYFLNFKDIHFIFVSKSSLLLKTLLMETEKNNKSNIRHFAVYFNFDILNRPGFNDTNEMFERLPYLKLLNKISQINVVDIKLFKYIQNIINCNPKIEALNKNNRFLNKTYCDVKKKFNLPENIMLICPYTQDNRVQCILCDKMHTETNDCIATRNFTIKDYYDTESILKSNKMIGVIVSEAQYINLPDETKKSFIDLTGKTSIQESLEILKLSSGYIGIDSFLSVFATKIFDNNNVIIKCYNKHGYEWKDVYWYPLNLKLNNFKNSMFTDKSIN
jgi:hypothetical protein